MRSQSARALFRCVRHQFFAAATPARKRVPITRFQIRIEWFERVVVDVVVWSHFLLLLFVQVHVFLCFVKQKIAIYNLLHNIKITNKKTPTTKTKRIIFFITTLHPTIYVLNYANHRRRQCEAGRSHAMAVNGKTSMISPPSSVSNGPEPSQLPPYPPPLRSGQVLQPLSVFTGMTTIHHCGNYWERNKKRRNGRTCLVPTSLIGLKNTKVRCSLFLLVFLLFGLFWGKENSAVHQFF